MKLTKPQIKAHREAMALVDCGRRLHDDEKEFILDNFHEGATHINSSAGAFFTPRGLARDFAIEVDGGNTDKARHGVCRSRPQRGGTGSGMAPVPPAAHEGDRGGRSHAAQVRRLERLLASATEEGGRVIDELELYKTDRAKWLADFGGPNMARRFRDGTYGDDAAYAAAWEGISDGSGKASDYQTAVWQHLDDTQRARIRALRKA